ncbi:MAG: ABC transporter ATP-binding protein [Sellimonas sp.]|uniref:ABC transporter ATP-binding protein n=1 Tax=Sellimonas sp. TaxID=2021466 RepID=UPI0039A1666B
MLKMKNVKKNYGNFQLDCTLEVPDGCITGLIGENGAGKSTTFKAIEKLIFIDSGEIEVFGKRHTEMTLEDKEKMGIVLSGSMFSEILSGKEIIRIMDSMYRNFRKDRFVKLCGKLSIPLDQKIKGFSSGMKAKLKIAAALSHEAKFLILDEPTAGLDVVARDELLNLLREYMEEDAGRSILISSHIAGDLEGLCDDLYMIHNGKIILHEETDILLSNYGLLKADEEQFRKLDKSYLLRVKKEHYGYSCLTDQIRFYRENYPDMVIEKSGIDDVIMMTIKGEEI